VVSAFKEIFDLKHRKLQSLELLLQNIPSDLLLQTEEMYSTQPSQQLKPMHSHPYQNVMRTGQKCHTSKVDPQTVAL
jgi:hypothetical protein